jgi:hypothetical protein
VTLDLRTVTGVELVKTGEWEISTGRWTVTPADLVAAVAAHRAGAIRRPPLRLGHVDERFDGEPAVGYVDNLRVTDAGRTLLGDYAGVPAWLADGVLASAYPDRSVEGIQGYTDAAGRSYSFVLTGVALLGVTAPGIGSLRSLQDVASLYGLAAASGQRFIRLHTTAPGDAGRRRRVVVRAAGTRRRQRRAVIILAALNAATTEMS